MTMIYLLECEAWIFLVLNHKFLVYVQWYRAIPNILYREYIPTKQYLVTLNLSSTAFFSSFCFSFDNWAFLTSSYQVDIRLKQEINTKNYYYYVNKTDFSLSSKAILYGSGNTNGLALREGECRGKERGREKEMWWHRCSSSTFVNPSIWKGTSIL